MKEFVIYLLKSGIWMTIFWGIYWFFLRKETFFRFNRIFLLVGLVASLALPFLQYRYLVIVNLQLTNTVKSISADAPKNFSINWLAILIGFYFFGAITLLIRHLIGLIKIRKMIKKGENIGNSDSRIINISDVQSSFSFFGYVFIDDSSISSETEKKLILEHEMAHVGQRHWVDLLLSQLVCAIQWFNPFAWLYLHAIKQNHEFLADQAVLQKGNSPAVYHAALINYTLKTPVFALANSFAHFNKFKRINMMKKHHSRPIKKFAVLLLIPALAAFLWAFAEPKFSISPSYDSKIKPVSSSINEGSIQAKSVAIYKAKTGKTVHAMNYEYNISIDTDSLPETTKRIVINGNDINQDSIVTVHATQPEGKHMSVAYSFSTRNQKEGNSPLIILDGKEIPNSSMNTISPESIESINILKDATSSAAYGKDGINGVILITTKKK